MSALRRTEGLKRVGHGPSSHDGDRRFNDPHRPLTLRRPVNVMQRSLGAPQWWALTGQKQPRANFRCRSGRYNLRLSSREFLGKALSLAPTERLDVAPFGLL